ncbi:MAG: hypothetical protein JWO67_2295 [Streptosporangiaceae bacterium]|nr:hypothetical protein [Streptosporangiaceae bacterium]
MNAFAALVITVWLALLFPVAVVIGRWLREPDSPHVGADVPVDTRPVAVLSPVEIADRAERMWAA